jgi:hypothetical protein
MRYLDSLIIRIHRLFIAFGPVQQVRNSGCKRPRARLRTSGAITAGEVSFLRHQASPTTVPGATTKYPALRTAAFELCIDDASTTWCASLKPDTAQAVSASSRTTSTRRNSGALSTRRSTNRMNTGMSLALSSR